MLCIKRFMLYLVRLKAGWLKFSHRRGKLRLQWSLTKPSKVGNDLTNLSQVTTYIHTLIHLLTF